ncbi:hypothetical protein [Oerskovia enterophila]|uniref:hypothetical protein n=1 Tax=Oerskovia enterophila TaxID=43678 RepID=UPI003397296C
MFVLSYFTTAEESLHLALSEDGVTFHAVDEGRELLRGSVGTRTLRDPFLHRTPDGVFHLLATDRWHSPDIVHATSDDLVTWSPQHTLPVMREVPGALNAWAPECFVDAEGTIRLLWSSLLSPDSADAPESWDNTPQDQRIWTATTTDFRTTSPAEVFFDPGYSVIDASVLPVRDGYLMAFKDERGDNEIRGSHKDIRTTKFTSTTGSFTSPSAPATPAPVEGPSMFRRGAHASEIVMIFDHFLEGRYSAVSSLDEGRTWSPTRVDLPEGVRHASVLDVPDDKVLTALVARSSLATRTG